jgi:hypothetical protein
MPAAGEFSHQHLTQLCVDRWSDFRELLHGFRVAWVSTASALIGLVLFLNAPQAQDLFLEVKGNPLSDALFWCGFYLAVVLAWALPVFVSAHWILVRFEEGPKAHPHVEPVKTWVSRKVPLVIGATCLVAVAAGQLMAMRNAPTLLGSAQEISELFHKANLECAERPFEVTCLDLTAHALGELIAQSVGRELVPHIGYAIAAVVILWFWFVRPSRSLNQPARSDYARRTILMLPFFVNMNLIAQASFPIVGLDYVAAYLLAAGLLLIVVCALAWRGMGLTLWWLGTVSSIPIVAFILYVFYGYLSLEFDQEFGLGHLVLLPAITLVMGVALWWALAPFSDGRASWVGQLLYRIGGGGGEIDEYEASRRFIDPLFAALLAVTVAVVIVLVFVHPLHTTWLFHRAVLLPIVLGMPVALFTYMTHWSARTRVPFVLAAVLVIGAIRVPYDVRPTRSALPRMPLKEAVEKWKEANACLEMEKVCPAPVIVAAAGGASRSAFYVAGVIGELLDEPHFSRSRLFAISAVSGGSLGAVLTYAALAEGTVEPPCRHEAGLNDKDWFGARVGVRRAQPTEPPADPDKSWRSCLELLSAGDFLSPVFLSTIGSDPLRLPIFLRGDRAVVLEQAWEARYAQLTGQESEHGIISKNSKNEGGTRLARSLSAVRHEASAPGRWLPILLLNGTSVQTGRRIVTSDVDTLSRDSNGEVTRRIFRDSYDLHELFCRQADNDKSGSAKPPGKDQAGSSTEPACQERDIRLSTAATMSARFPVVSPPGSIRGADGQIVDRVVDGGYYENFGATTAMELATELIDFKLKPIVVLIANDPHTSQMECVTGKIAFPNPNSTPWFPTFTSSLDALFATRDARGTYAAVSLCEQRREDRTRFKFVTVEPDPDNPAKDLSMSWWLSKHVQKYLDDQIGAPHNQIHSLND